LNIEYKEITHYLPTRPGPRIVKIYQSQTNNLLLEIPYIEVIPGQIMTFAVLGSLNNLQYMPIIDDVNVDIMPDRTKIRFYNLTNYNVNVSLSSSIGSSALTLDSGSGSKYTQIKPDSYTLEIRTPNQRPKTISINFKPGRIYTIYIITNVEEANQSFIPGRQYEIVSSVDGNTVFKKCT